MQPQPISGLLPFLNFLVGLRCQQPLLVFHARWRPALRCSTLQLNAYLPTAGGFFRKGISGGERKRWVARTSSAPCAALSSLHVRTVTIVVLID